MLLRLMFIDHKEQETMTRPTSVTSNEPTLHAALELSKNSWLLGVQFPDRDKPSLYPLKGGDADGLLDKLDSARNRVAKVTGRMAKLMLCYEAGYDGVWLARVLEQNGIVCKVMDPASLQIDHRPRAQTGNRSVALSRTGPDPGGRHPVGKVKSSTVSKR